MRFEELQIPGKVLEGIKAAGFTECTPVQALTLPRALIGKDIAAQAQTGTGKTAAFVLPILNRLSHEKTAARKVIKSLIITPTRELAAQIEEAIHGYGRFLHVSTVAIYGGVSIKNQLNALRHGVDIVVATPGRLMDHIQRRSVDLRHIEVLVLDEDQSLEVRSEE